MIALGTNWVRLVVNKQDGKLRKKLRLEKVKARDYLDELSVNGWNIYKDFLPTYGDEERTGSVCLRIVFFFYFLATAQRGPGPPSARDL